ncbi:hypothetical protein QYF36_003280 [Acer negundo]|nr:hypothetical protein QYF36_003280 [Acer negundo]
MLYLLPLGIAMILHQKNYMTDVIHDHLCLKIENSGIYDPRVLDRDDGTLEWDTIEWWEVAFDFLAVALVLGYNILTVPALQSEEAAHQLIIIGKVDLLGLWIAIMAPSCGLLRPDLVALVGGGGN